MEKEEQREPLQKSMDRNNRKTPPPPYSIVQILI